MEKSSPPTLKHSTCCQLPKSKNCTNRDIFVRNEPPHVEHELNISLCSPQHWINFHSSAHTREHPTGPVAEEHPCLWQGWDGFPAALRSPSPSPWTQVQWQSGWKEHWILILLVLLCHLWQQSRASGGRCCPREQSKPPQPSWEILAEE